MSRILELAEIIKEHEGYFAQSRSWRNKNPGCLRWTPYTQSLGAIGRDAGNFCIFEKYEDGFEALCQFLRDALGNKLRPYHIFSSRIPYHKKLLPDGKDGNKLPDLTLFDFFNIYSPSFENDSEAYAIFAAKKLRVSTELLVKELL